MDGSELLKIALSNGWPTAIVVAGSIALWRFARWAKPILERAAAVHIETVEKVGTCQQEISSTLLAMSEAVKPIGKIDEIHGDMRAIKNVVVRKWPDGLA